MHVIDDADPVVNLHVATFYPVPFNLASLPSGLFPVSLAAIVNQSLSTI
jgi:hypothetical protein